LEYALIIAVVVAGLLAMQIYMKRGVQGKLRQTTDDIGAQFEAEKTKVVSNITRTGTTVEETISGNTTVYSDVAEKTGSKAETVTRSGSESVGGF
jgi:uncharacterized membrane-anchored protein YhcB (DUF1043 family)